MQKLFQLFRKFVNWPAFILLLVAVFVCNLGFIWRSKKLGPISELPDAQLWYSQTTAVQFLEKIQHDGRNLFAWTELSLDVIYPMVYVATISVVIIRLYPEQVARRILILPLMAGVFDLLENFQLTYLALSFDGTESAVATTAAVCTATKFAFLGTSGLALVAGVAVWFTGRKNQRS